MGSAIVPASVDEPDVAALVVLHHADMAALSPGDSMHGLDAAALRHPSITLFAARDDGELVGVAALAALADGDVELKSMRVADRFRGTGAGRLLLRHLVAVARDGGAHAMWLETGAGEAWLPARRLYAQEGFVGCGPFGSYRPDPFSTFMVLALETVQDPVQDAVTSSDTPGARSTG